MSAIQLVVALVLVAIGGALFFRWLQSRHDNARKESIGKGDCKANNSKQQQRTAGRNAGSNGDDLRDGSSNDDENQGVGDGSGGGQQDNTARGGAGRLNRSAGVMRRRGTGRHGAHSSDNANDAFNDSSPNDGVDDAENNDNKVRLTRLQRKKLAKEREREERRQAQEIALEAQRQQSDASRLRDAEVALKEEELKAAEELALRQLRADKEQADNEEYAKWVGHIGVEERGELGDEARERQARVHAFLLERAAVVQARAQRRSTTTATTTGKQKSSHSNDHSGCDNEEGKTGEDGASSSEGHVLVLQSAARELKVSVEELVTGIEQLTREGKVDGVFDDRGKYVFIAPEHFPQLAQFIRLRGRVSVQEFTRECNRIIMQT